MISNRKKKKGYPKNVYSLKKKYSIDNNISKIKKVTQLNSNKSREFKFARDGNYYQALH